ncbi:MAG TPA: hypothetical protein VKE40_27080 [Gemmataceae bacterium]|nr:hypothetical protein [Gemmataceae bacterium]
MNRLVPFCVISTALSAVAAPLVVGKGRDYQKMADEASWKAPEAGEDFRRCLARDTGGYQVEAVASTMDVLSDTTIRVLDGGTEVSTWQGHQGSVFFIRDNILYHTDYCTISSGCTVIAFDLKAKKKLWKTELKGLGPISHSKYRNLVRMDQVNGEVLAVYGQESAGRYVEFVELKTGKTVGNKVFKDEK